MRPVFIASDNIITSLGFTTPEVVVKLKDNYIGIKTSDDPGLTPVPLPLSQVNSCTLVERFDTMVALPGSGSAGYPYTRLEMMFMLSVHDAIRQCGLDLSGPGTILIISTTKGNIDLLEEDKKKRFASERVYLWELAEVIRKFFGFRNTPVIISNACISGSLAIGLGFRYIKMGLYDNAVIAGGDILSKFVVSGFRSFQALSPDPCRPFDKDRTGLSLGEGCGTMVLTADRSLVKVPAITVDGFATTNDANHISGPSRTGEELSFAIDQSIKQAGVTAASIDFISAHGTATSYNDEMESKALALSGLGEAPVNSFKGYWGHTLGAAGVIESVAAIQSMRDEMLFRSAGFHEAGVPVKINVIAEHRKSRIRYCLKTASGFGGCNSSLVFRKH
jgi:3-oxoacyl-[acyl-carrier-protein] synthase I